MEMECVFDENEIEYKSCDSMCSYRECMHHVDHHETKKEDGHYGYYNSRGEWKCYLNCNMCEIEELEEQIKDNMQEFEKNK